MIDDEKETQLSEEARLDALLQEFLEEPEDTQAYPNFANGYGEALPHPVEEYSDGGETPEKSHPLRGLLIADGLLLLGIAGVLAWWCIRYL